MLLLKVLRQKGISIGEMRLSNYLLLPASSSGENEFNGVIKGVSVLVESKEVKQRLIEDYTSLVKLSDVDEYNQEFNVEPGNSLSKFS